MFPTLRALGEPWDDQIFDTGGLLLLESLRVNRLDFWSGLRISLLLFVATQLILLLARSRLTAVLVDTSEGGSARKALLSETPTFVLVSLMKLVAVCVVCVVSAVSFSQLPEFEGQLPAHLLLIYALTLLATLLALGAIVCTFDLYRIAIFMERDWRVRLRAVHKALREHGASLLARRAVWAGVSLVAGALTFRLSSRPLLGDGLGALATFVLAQFLVVAVLLAETWWLLHAERRLAASGGELLRQSETA